jgi:hypothetical protein
MAYRLHLPKRTTTDRQVSTVRVSVRHDQYSFSQSASTGSIQSARPDAHESAKAKANAPTNQIDQKYADNPIGKILPFSILKVLY